jgi:hypothetical protein
LGSASTGFTVYQSAHLVVGATVGTQHGTRQLLVSVGLAEAARIDISLLLSAGGHGVIVAHAQARAGGIVVVRIPLPKLSAATTARITVTIQTRDGVRETKKLSIRVTTPHG